MMIYIYGLCDPDTGEVRYVGKTDNLRKRLMYHLSKAPRKNTLKDKWIRSLLIVEKKPDMIILETCAVEVWAERESFWMSQYPRLTNLGAAGAGGGKPKRLSHDPGKPAEKKKKTHDTGTKLIRGGLSDEEHAYVTAALDTEQRRAVLLAAADRESEPTSFRPAGETLIVTLVTTLPCSIRAGTPSGVCEKPATQAYAWPQEPSGPWPTPGLWTVQPVCAACAKAAAAVYVEQEEK